MNLVVKYLIVPLAALCCALVVCYVGFVFGTHNGVDSHPLPVVIPNDRITGTRGEKIGPDVAIYCTRDLKNCTHTGLPGEVHKYHFVRNEWMDLCAKVEFVPEPQWTFTQEIYALIVACILAITMVVAMGFYIMLRDAILQDYNRFMRKNVFVRATGHDGAARVHEASRNTETMMTYTPEDGFRLHLLWKDAPVFPAWKFDKVEAPGTPLRLAKKWIEVARLYNTKGVRYDIGYDVGVEWRDGGMRVWISDTAYDSSPMTPAEAPNNVSE